MGLLAEEPGSQNRRALRRVRAAVGGLAIALAGMTVSAVESPAIAAAESSSTVTVGAVADVMVDSSRPTLAMGRWNYLNVDTAPLREIYLRFDTSTLTGNVTNAVLRLHGRDTDAAASPAGGDILAVSDPWDETTTTFENRPALIGPAAASIGPVTRNTWVEVDVTTLVTTGGPLSLGIRSTIADGAYYDSREVPAFSPTLTITTDTTTTTTTTAPTTTTPTTTTPTTTTTAPTTTTTTTTAPTTTTTTTTAPTTTTTTTVPGSSSTVTVGAVADVMVDSSRPTLAMGRWNYLNVDTAPLREIYLRFDTSTLTGNVTNAVLRLHGRDTDAAASPAGGDILAVSDPWDETTTTFENRPALIGPAAASIGPVTRNTWVEVDVTTLVTTGGPLSLGIRSTIADGAYYDSREVPAFSPTLTITTDTTTTTTTTAPTTTTPTTTTPTTTTTAPTTTTTTTTAPTTTTTTTTAPTTTTTTTVPGSSSTVTVGAVADVMVDSSRPTLAMGRWNYLNVDTAPLREIYLRFDTSTLTGNVTNAVLRLHGRDTDAAASPAGGDILAVSDPWDETTTTFENRPALIGPAAASIGPVTRNTWVEVDVTTLVTTGGPLSLGIRSTIADGAYYDSREVPAFSPTLTITTDTTTIPDSVTFHAVGDIGGGSTSGQVLGAIGADPGDVLLALGDLSYDGPGSEEPWCDFVRDAVGSEPVQLVPGNHEDDDGEDGRISAFADCLPDAMSSEGSYPTQYFFDLSDLVRVIVISPDLTIDGVTFTYAPGTSHRQWLVDSIAGARASGVRWVVVATHELCVSVGVAPCEIRPDLLEVLDDSDLVLNGHDHVYQRTHKLAANPLCPAFAPGSFNAACVAQQASGGVTSAGGGVVTATVGTGGESLFPIRFGDPDVPYFATWMGSNTPGAGYGYLRLTANEDSLRGEYVNVTGTYADSFTIRV